MEDDSGGTPTEYRWPVKDIIYLSVIGPFMLAAVIEWLLWLAAFLYCFVKVFQKADHWSVQCLAALMSVLFLILRLAFLPAMLVTLPLPSPITEHFPHWTVMGFQWFAFWSFSVLLVGPWLFCVYRLSTNSLGRTKRIKEVLDDRTAPKTVVVMPVYKEKPEVLIKAVDSVVESDYPTNCIHVFLSYDGNAVDESYLQVITHLGVPLLFHSYPQSIDVVYKGARVTISRFIHGGKRHCQKQTFKLIDKVYADYLKRNDDLFLLFIDSDCLIDKLCLQNFMYDMELKPGSKHSMLAMTGIITSTTEKWNVLTILQDMEYVHGQLFERSVESGCGAVTCLPGALTILRFSAFRKMAKYYFADKAEQCDDLFDYGKCHLGEDRWLTHLFMIGAKERYQIQMCTSAFCKTEAVRTFGSLLKQRRRWFLGFVTNEVCMLTDARLWRRYPMLCLVRFLQNTIRTTALLFFIMVIALMTTAKSVKEVPIGFIAVALGLNYLLMFYFGARLKRFKAWLYPLMFIFNPFFNWIYMVYGICTAGQRTWGGPRADAAAADAYTTPEEAVKQARAQGDELNVNVDTFRTNLVRRRSVPVRPPDKIEGRFAPAEQLYDGYYANMNDSGPSIIANRLAPLPNVPRIHLSTHESSDSMPTISDNSISLPWNADTLMSEEDQKKSLYARYARSSASIISVDESTGIIPPGPDPAVLAAALEPPPRRSSIDIAEVMTIYPRSDMSDPDGEQQTEEAQPVASNFPLESQDNPSPDPEGRRASLLKKLRRGSRKSDAGDMV
ncbi:hypothetical protein N7510_004075 [Penicillium lagena]|uniref:uncharacterized protein n=1 Tax=Penicillium lagena TaxID=94218 RepID=UPI002541F781|nr:uncharacterized protein N7510_004075 [Penicillium lagena]KAJ5620091.1 hypothetical protein N7510_004075 [Penicillium lagena]